VFDNWALASLLQQLLHEIEIRDAKIKNYESGWKKIRDAIEVLIHGGVLRHEVKGTH
jgi:hypothetical protein